MVKSFAKSHDLFILHIFSYQFVFPWLKFKDANIKVLQIN